MLFVLSSFGFENFNVNLIQVDGIACCFMMSKLHQKKTIDFQKVSFCKFGLYVLSRNECRTRSKS